MLWFIATWREGTLSKLLSIRELTVSCLYEAEKPIPEEGTVLSVSIKASGECKSESNKNKLFIADGCALQFVFRSDVEGELVLKLNGHRLSAADVIPDQEISYPGPGTFVPPSMFIHHASEEALLKFELTPSEEGQQNLRGAIELHLLRAHDVQTVTYRDLETVMTLEAGVRRAIPLTRVTLPDLARFARGCLISGRNVDPESLRKFSAASEAAIGVTIPPRNEILR